ncbi:cytochrome-c oxidase, cbb3-type subunit III [Aquabacterium sp. A7-Y]|uniref:cytochrome-c oxidase, cbb3-type subunit III n=1 Tax=Aquabacterium sp. A7-Y TaxID=1349605 RepID=UPI00223E2CAB|nr:cytochrome-c oxidase, cbb3-type subunit III [Aquabacterium sp. A7-Y]MCW7537778.1 cytochrome-c oxidase, cbb3-type subunit III [Aquabacterium sp. A7-Y]
MSDFFNSGWSVYIAVVTVLSVLACLALLIVASRRKVMSDDDTTGHVWDGDLRELNNPLPRWWMGLFVLTIVFAFGYLALYPGLGSYQGTTGWSQEGQYRAEVERARQELGPLYARFEAKDARQLAGDAQAMGIGERLFVNNCAQCHGSDARGSKGFPNLTDSDWLYGGSHEQIIESITKGRHGNMPPMAAAVGTSEEVRQLAHYVLSLSGSPHNTIAAQKGRDKFGACAACHGPGGRGNPALGAPNLSDRTWLHGWGEQAIVNIINSGKSNQMPAHGDKLTEPQIRVLAAYVWGMSNGRTERADAAASK